MNDTPRLTAYESKSLLQISNLLELGGAFNMTQHGSTVTLTIAFQGRVTHRQLLGPSSLISLDDFIAQSIAERMQQK